jgi:hypothetical protein
MILNKINIIYIRKNFQITFLVTFSLKENKMKIFSVKFVKIMIKCRH